MAFTCTLQVIRLDTTHDEPLLAIGINRPGEGHPGSTGLRPVPVGCAEDLRCLVEHLCAVARGCPWLQSVRFPEPGPNAPPRRFTPEVCADAWNVHGGFAPNELAQGAASVGPRPVHAPHLAAASLGFIGPRAEVRAREGGCSVLFDLGGGVVYAVDASVEYAPRFWTWAGRTETTTAKSETPAWNACQRDDGTLSLDGDCRHDPRVAARDIRDEIERRYADLIGDLGGFPYWLGLRFLGARPEPLRSGEAEGAVGYTLETPDGPLTLRVLTYRPPRREIRVRGFEVMRADPADATVVVVADVPSPTQVREAVRSELRPFRENDPHAEQIPGDLGEEPTRIDASAGVRVYWVGPAVAGRRAEVIASAPRGAGVVRYGAPGAPNTFYVVTYKPRKKTRCSSLGCVAPPPLPRSLERFGVRVETSLLDEWVVDVLAPSKKAVPAEARIAYRLTRMR